MKKLFILTLLIAVAVYASTYREYEQSDLFLTDSPVYATGAYPVETTVFLSYLSGHIANRGVVWVLPSTPCEQDTMILFVRGARGDYISRSVLDTIWLPIKPDSISYAEIDPELDSGSGFVDYLKVYFAIQGNPGDSVGFQAGILIEYSERGETNIYTGAPDTLSLSARIDEVQSALEDSAAAIRGAIPDTASLSARIDAKADSGIAVYLLDVPFGRSGSVTNTFNLQYSAQGNTSTTIGAIMPRSGRIVDVTANVNVSAQTSPGRVIARGFVSNFTAAYAYAYTDSININGVAAYRATKTDINVSFNAGDVLGAQIIWGSFVGTISNANISLWIRFD